LDDAAGDLSWTPLGQLTVLSKTSEPGLIGGRLAVGRKGQGEEGRRKGREKKGKGRGDRDGQEGKGG